MNWIEVMGLSGTGKSTFLKKLTAERENNEKWVLLDEALKEVTLMSLKKHPVDKFLKFYLKQKFINSKKKSIPDMILRKNEAYFQEAKKYEDLISHSLNFHFRENSNDSIEKTYRISLYKSIIENICILDFWKFRKLVIMDEGPFNHLPNIKGLKDKLTVLPKGFIFCDLDEETNFDRIKNREKHRGRPSPIHRGLDDDQLKEDIHVRRKAFLRKREILISLGIPFLDINLNELSMEKLNHINSFFLNLSDNIKL